MRWSILLGLAFPLLAAENTPSPEVRGRRIYEQGLGSSGIPVQAVLPGSVRVPASIVPCRNCHGSNGEGKPEGGVAPSNLTWEALTKPYGLTHADGRTHSPYDERSLRRAITMGVDPSGNPLNAAMPRFQLSMADAADLIRYVKTLGIVQEPGVTETSVQLGVLLPPGDHIMREVLLRNLARVNEEGGIFGRHVAMKAVTLPVEPSKRKDVALAFLRSENVFAIVAADFRASEADLSCLMRDTGTPAIATLAATPQPEAVVNSFVFYLNGAQQNLSEQAIWARTTASYEIVIEAMRRVGRSLTRADLIQTIESFHEFPTSLGQSMTFGPNRRTGSAAVR